MSDSEISTKEARLKELQEQIEQAEIVLQEKRKQIEMLQNRSNTLSEEIALKEEKKKKEKPKHEKRNFIDKLIHPNRKSEESTPAEHVISSPHNFTHKFHMNFNPDGTVDLDNMGSWKPVLEKAGVTQIDLNQRQMVAFILHFVQKSMAQHLAAAETASVPREVTPGAGQIKPVGAATSATTAATATATPTATATAKPKKHKKKHHTKKKKSDEKVKATATETETAAAPETAKTEAAPEIVVDVVTSSEESDVPEAPEAPEVVVTAPSASSSMDSVTSDLLSQIETGKKALVPPTAPLKSMDEMTPTQQDDIAAALRRALEHFRKFTKYSNVDSPTVREAKDKIKEKDESKKKKEK